MTTILKNTSERPPAKDPLFLTLLTTFLLSASDALSTLLTSGQELSKRSLVVCLLTALGMTIRVFHEEIRTGLRIFDGPPVRETPPQPHSSSEEGVADGSASKDPKRVG